MVVAFVVQIVVGSLLFFLLYLVAVGLSLAIHFVNERAVDAPSWLHVASGYVEMVLFGADLVAFAMFILTEIVKFGRALWQEATHHGSH